jgi:hypothetical protein
MNRENNPGGCPQLLVGYKKVPGTWSGKEDPDCPGDYCLLLFNNEKGDNY